MQLFYTFALFPMACIGAGITLAIGWKLARTGWHVGNDAVEFIEKKFRPWRKL